MTLELCGIHSLSFAVGAYLPIATTAPIFVGGLVRWWVERKTGETSDSDLSSGTLFSSGLIAGGSLAGILFAVLFGADDGSARSSRSATRCRSCIDEGASGQIAGALLFFGAGGDPVALRAQEDRVGRVQRSTRISVDERDGRPSPSSSSSS